jgi:hypothetical protein
VAGEDCGLLDVGCEVGNTVENAVSSAAGNAIQQLADSVGEAVIEGLQAVGTLWLKVPTPEVTGNRPVGGVAAATPNGTSGLESVLGWVVWISLGICVLSLIVAGVRLALPNRHGSDLADGVTHVGRTLVAVIVISGAASLVAAIMERDATGQDASSTVAFVQNSLWWYVLALAMVSVIIGGARMAWEQRAQPGKDLVQSMLTLLVVTGFGLAAVGIFVTAADEFSSWIIEESLKEQGGASFKDAVENLLGFNALTGGAASAIAVIVLGLVAFLACLLQVMLMVVRGAMLILLAGILPAAAAATNTELGRTWFKRCIAWLVAFILYKPAAAIVYATAFRLLDTNIERDTDGLVTALTGMALMVMAIVALPALLRFVTPMVGAVAGSGGGGVAGALSAVPAMGAVSAGRRSGTGAPSSGGSSSASGTGGSPTGSAGGSAGDGSGSSGSRDGNGTGRVGPSGAPGRANTPAGAPAGGGGAGSAPATAGVAARGSAAGAGAAAAGPAGVAAVGSAAAAGAGIKAAANGASRGISATQNAAAGAAGGSEDA